MILNWLMYHLFFKKDTFNKQNYRPVRILPKMSKIFEMIFYKQIDTFMITEFSPNLCGFTKKL